MTRLARDWTAAFGSSDGDYEPNAEDNPFTLIGCVVTGDPLYAWHLLMEVVKHDTERRSLPLLASSHLETFLELHGDAMIDYIEEDIQQSPPMREMLWFVRQMGTPDHVWARIEALKSTELPAT